MKKQLATITVIMSSHGTVTGAAFHPVLEKDEKAPPKLEVDKLLYEVRLNDATTTPIMELN